MKPAETADSGWKDLYRVGGAAALIVVMLILSEIIGFTFYPQPSTVIGWFTLFQSNRIIGLLDFWGLEVPMYALFTMVFLALYVVLRKANEGWMAIAMTLALLGIGIFFATNNPFSMLSLSDQYAAATTDAQRSMFLAAGQALLANTNQRAVGGFNMGLFLVSVAGLIVSLVMFRSNSFSRLTAYVGILANVLSLADYLREALVPSGVVALLVILPNALFLGIWFVLVGRRLYQLGQGGSKIEANPNLMQTRVQYLIGVLAAFIALTTIAGGIATLVGAEKLQLEWYETRLSPITPFPHSCWPLP